ncbi:hypothetical protein BV25DRAFT_1922742 [Artomyces pyxidatus]|uniref:Uncharacterized protein n=1 Tax=Artomyces pyxidatus TaxID=48021 RepID=A0ACB8SD42_9AGAM|nr:hypothetical protein BV25DRAFT_1922742 [Artomyces pyxidatus]
MADLIWPPDSDGTDLSFDGVAKSHLRLEHNDGIVLFFSSLPALQRKLNVLQPSCGRNLLCINVRRKTKGMVFGPLSLVRPVLTLYGVTLSSWTPTEYTYAGVTLNSTTYNLFAHHCSSKAQKACDD